MRLMRGLVGVVLVTACVAALSGCSRANAGSATEDDFAQFMADTDGVTDTGGFVSNNLPFLGSGDLEVELRAVFRIVSEAERKTMPVELTLDRRRLPCVGWTTIRLASRTGVLAGTSL